MLCQLDLVHQTSQRWRFKLTGPLAVPWDILLDHLHQFFPLHSWSVRINPSASSLVIQSLNCMPSLPSRSSYVYQGVSKQLHQLGFDVSVLPLSPVVVIHDRNTFSFSLGSNVLNTLFNGISICLSLSLLFLSGIVFIFSFFGLFLPLSPGIWLMILATSLLEMAISVRRPFVL